MSLRGDEIAVVYNVAGAPRTHAVAIPPLPPRGAAPVVPPRPTSFVSGAWPACAAGGAFTYCARGTTLLAYRRGPDGVPAAEGKKIVEVRGPTKLAATALGTDHAVAVFIDERTTTEGKTRQAFGVVDDGLPVRVSEDGSGATVVDVAPHRDGALILYVDARTSMTPIHARVARLDAGKPQLVLERDAVLAIGGSAERGLSGVLASTGKDAFALVPMPEGSSAFGLAIVKVGDPPKEDAPLAWSRYPNGLDPAPVAATTSGSPPRVLRARPLDATFNGPRVLELGHLDDAGNFRSDAILEPGTPMAEVAILADTRGSVWLLHGDATGTWLERRTCER